MKDIFNSNTQPLHSGLFKVDRGLTGIWFRYFNVETNKWGMTYETPEQALKNKDHVSALGVLPWSGPIIYNGKDTLVLPKVDIKEKHVPRVFTLPKKVDNAPTQTATEQTPLSALQDAVSAETSENGPGMAESIAEKSDQSSVAQSETVSGVQSVAETLPQDQELTLQQKLAKLNAEILKLQAEERQKNPPPYTQTPVESNGKRGRKGLGKPDGTIFFRNDGKWVGIHEGRQCGFKDTLAHIQKHMVKLGYANPIVENAPGQTVTVSEIPKKENIESTANTTVSAVFESLILK